MKLLTKAKMRIAIGKLRDAIENEVEPTREKAIKFTNWVYDTICTIPDLVEELSEEHGELLLRVINALISIEPLIDKYEKACSSDKPLKALAQGMTTYGEIFTAVGNLFAILDEAEGKGELKEVIHDIKFHLDARLGDLFKIFPSLKKKKTKRARKYTKRKTDKAYKSKDLGADISLN